MIARITMTLAAIALTAIVLPSSARADDCCRATVSGCGKSMNVCLPGDCNGAAERKARDLFEKAQKCSSSGISSTIHTCSGETCDLDLR